MLAAAPANAGDCRRAGANAGPRWSRANHTGRPFAGRAGGGRLRREIPAEGALRCSPTSRRATAAEAAQREKVWQGRQQQIALGGEAMARGRAAKLLRPARAKPMWRRWRRGCAGYAATVISPRRMLAHDDIHRWLADYRGRLRVVWRAGCHYPTGVSAGSGAALRRPSPSLRLDMPAISITKSF